MPHAVSPSEREPLPEPLPEPLGAFEAPEALVGQVLDGRYRLLSLISQGSMGAVYRAEQLQLGRVVAIKLMWLDESMVVEPARATAAELFLHEAATLARLDARNTVRIFDFGVWRERPYLVMEYIAGQRLATIIRQEGHLAPSRAVSLAVQACRSLREAHRLGVVHRDLKPANILVTIDEEGELVKVVDFGLVTPSGGRAAKAEQGRLVGSPRYMAPEQIQEQAVDGRTDVYSLGVLLFHMLTGELPFAPKGTAPTLLAHLSEPPPTLAAKLGAGALPACFEWTVATALAKDPDERFASVDELRTALGACQVALAGGPALAHVQPSLVDGRCVLPDALLDGHAPRASEHVDRPTTAPEAGSAPVLKVMLGLVVAVLGIAVLLLLLDPGPT
jgi:serine/threonine-protein kinase